MGFRNFRLQVTLRICVLVMVLAALIYCLLSHRYLRSVYLLAALVLAIVEFIRYVEKSNRDYNTFLLAILQSDFTTTYAESGKGKSFDQLYQTFNQITNKFRSISEAKEAQYRYLELLVEHVRVGILSFDKEEHIHLINNSMKELLSHPEAHSLKGLEARNPLFVKTLREIHAGENRLVKMEVNGKLIPLTLHAGEFNMQDSSYKLISAQDIRNELEAAELDAWQKLIRVLTHEIMNSISPVMSLSNTLHDLVARKKGTGTPIGAEDQEVLSQGLEAIRSRSEALQRFTKAYRSLTRVPQPQFKTVAVSDLINHVVTLFRKEIDERKVQLVVNLPNIDLTLSVDATLIEQVLINLLTNALDAVREITEPRIIVSVNPGTGQVSIAISDNGPGIPHELLDKVFIPFFTTKKTGSGIGLALSKQIVQLHRGEINIDTSPSEGTTVTLLL